MSYPRSILLLLVALLASVLVACDEETPIVTPVTGSITGAVTSNGTGLPGVMVTLSNGRVATTDAAGSFAFANVETGAYTTTISGYPADVAFPATTQPVVIVSEGQAVPVNFNGLRVATSTPTATSTSGATAIQVTTSTAIDHPPFARSYPTPGASVLIACIAGDFPAQTVFVIQMTGNGGDGEHEGAAGSAGSAAIPVPIQMYGPFEWTILGATLPGGQALEVTGGDTGEVGADEQPACP